MASSFVVGVFAAATQILVPFASHLAPEATRGKVVGNVMSGLLGGIMLARPFSSYVAATFGWRAVFYISAGMMLTPHPVAPGGLGRSVGPAQSSRIRRFDRSLPGIVASTPALRRRAFSPGNDVRGVQCLLDRDTIAFGS